MKDSKGNPSNLMTNKDKYYSLYELVPVGYFIFNQDGLILEVNQRGTEMLDSSRKLLINKPLGGYISNFYHLSFQR